MQYIDIIQASIDYIEENLKTDITVEELSKAAGFSLYHYYRLFHNAVGIPVKHYIVRRRLLWAAFETANGKKQIEAALDYGFDTAAGFYKAFVREFGCSPSEYSKRFTAHKPYRIVLKQEEQTMITHKRIASIITNWGLENEEIKNTVCQSSGQMSENIFCIGDRYLLKAFSNSEKIRNNVAVAHALCGSKISFSSPIKTLNGNYYVRDDELFFMLTDRIKGEPINADDMYKDNYKEKAIHIGEIIGILHNALKSADDILCDKYDIFNDIKENLISRVKVEVGLSDAFCNDYLAKIDDFYGKLPEQIIHRDPNPSNIMVDNGRFFGFTDFDLSVISIRIFDPCYAATAILSETFDGMDDKKWVQWLEIYRNIIRGYSREVCLTSEEKQALPYVVLAIQIICTDFFAGKEKYKRLFDINADMLRRIIDDIQAIKFE